MFRAVSAEASGCSRPRHHGGIPGSRWRRRRHPKRGELRVARGAERPSSAVATTRRGARLAQDRAAARRSLLASPRRQGGCSESKARCHHLPRADGAELGLLPATQVPAAPVARAAGKPICEQDGDGQLGLCIVERGGHVRRSASCRRRVAHLVTQSGGAWQGRSYRHLVPHCVGPALCGVAHYQVL